MENDREVNLENTTHLKFNINTIRTIKGLVLCIVLFIPHSISMVFLLWFFDNIIYWGDKTQYICQYDCGFGLFAILFAPIISFFVCLYIFFLFLYKKNIYIFVLIVPIYNFIIMKIIGNKIIDYFDISEYLGIAEIIDLIMAILLYMITKILIENFTLKDEK